MTISDQTKGMKMIVLAAGKGERLMPLTRNKSKLLLELDGGTTLLDEQTDRYAASGVVRELIFVSGYCADEVEAHLHDLDAPNLHITSIYNPFFDISNNLISLWLATREMHEDFLVTNGDNIFNPDVITSFVSSVGEGVYLATIPKQTYDDDDMKVIVLDGCVVSVSKDIEPSASSAESPGLAAVRGAVAREAFRESLDRLIRIPEYRNAYWLEVFNDLSRHGRPVIPWSFVGENNWQEIDFHMDLEHARHVARLRIPPSSALS